MSGAIQVGFDGGGTRSQLIVRTDSSTERNIFPLTIKYTDVGVAESVRRFSEMLSSLIPTAPWDTATIGISLSGASNEEKNSEWVGLLRATFSEKDLHINIESDSVATLTAAYPNQESGYLLIAGTGSVAIARDRERVIHKAGGWGRVLGDEGSGYWIGLQAIKHWMLVQDTGSQPTELSTAIESALIPETGGEFSVLRTKLYSNQINPSTLAPVVFNAAKVSTSKNEALSILEQGAQHLVGLIKTIKGKAEGNIEQVITLHGSVCTQPVYTELISEALNDEYELRMMGEWDVAEYYLNK